MVSKKQMVSDYKLTRTLVNMNEVAGQQGFNNEENSTYFIKKDSRD